jgi:phage recombination protein Bet
MNAIAKTEPTAAEVLKVLENSLYPGAKPESIQLVLSYCRVNGMDPMLKPVHIVPTSVKKPDGKWETRDVLMPGIADYRIKASRTGQYAGKSEPEFGPDISTTIDNVPVTYPEWCRVTVYRLVGGHARPFPANERWLENYAVAGRDTEAPNKMWRKRAYGQLAKCAEAQALRMAFPEFSGGVPTAEEMEGKTLNDFAGTTLEHDTPPTTERDRINRDVPLADPPPKPRGVRTEWLDALEGRAAACQSIADVDALVGADDVQRAMKAFQNGHKTRLDGIIAAAIERLAPRDEEPAEQQDWIDEAPAEENRQVTSAIQRMQRDSRADLEAVNKLAAHQTWLRSLPQSEYDRYARALEARYAELARQQQEPVS